RSLRSPTYSRRFRWGNSLRRKNPLIQKQYMMDVFQEMSKPEHQHTRKRQEEGIAVAKAEREKH
ncbi:MAG: hypothetical protein ACI32N_06410, partial [Bulleidia sp.]